jgi:hypothetical protein
MKKRKRISSAVELQGEEGVVQKALARSRNRRLQAEASADLLAREPWARVVAARVLEERPRWAAPQEDQEPERPRPAAPHPAAGQWVAVVWGAHQHRRLALRPPVSLAVPALARAAAGRRPDLLVRRSPLRKGHPRPARVVVRGQAAGRRVAEERAEPEKQARGNRAAVERPRLPGDRVGPGAPAGPGPGAVAAAEPPVRGAAAGDKFSHPVRSARGAVTLK